MGDSLLACGVDALCNKVAVTSGDNLGLRRLGCSSVSGDKRRRTYGRGVFAVPPQLTVSYRSESSELSESRLRLSFADNKVDPWLECGATDGFATVSGEVDKSTEGELTRSISMGL